MHFTEVVKVLLPIMNSCLPEAMVILRALQQVDPRTGRWTCIFCGQESSDHGLLGGMIQVQKASALRLTLTEGHNFKNAPNWVGAFWLLLAASALEQCNVSSFTCMHTSSWEGCLPLCILS